MLDVGMSDDLCGRTARAGTVYSAGRVAENDSLTVGAPVRSSERAAQLHDGRRRSALHGNLDEVARSAKAAGLARGVSDPLIIG